MKILIGVDGSACSAAALDFVSQWGLPAESRILIVSAMHPPYVAYADAYVGSSASAEELLKEETKAHHEYVAQAERRLRDGGIRAETRVIAGDPRDVIVRTAADEGTELIVVGSHGRTGMAKLIMGSVATHVVTHAPCSVLVVKTDRATA